MKTLKIDQDVEKLLATVCDAALKTGGMQLLGVVNQLLTSIQQSPSADAIEPAEIK